MVDKSTFGSITRFAEQNSLQGARFTSFLNGLANHFDMSHTCVHPVLGANGMMEVQPQNTGPCSSLVLHFPLSKSQGGQSSGLPVMEHFLEQIWFAVFFVAAAAAAAVFMCALLTFGPLQLATKPVHACCTCVGMLNVER